MKTKQKIFAFHLLNDRSGSPKVLSQLIKHWVREDKIVHLYTNENKEGFLSDIQGVIFTKGWYKFQRNEWLRLIFFTTSQLILMFKMFLKISKDDIVYVNTVLPFGAAIIGKIRGARVIYHIHESTVNPAILKWFLFKVVKYTASDIINVSEYVAFSHKISTVTNHLVYNTIEDSFMEKVLLKSVVKNPQNVLMICSLKTYKGVFEFIQLACDHQMYSFRLVLNASQKEIDDFFKDTKIPENLVLYPSQKDLHPFFQWADVIANLSRPDGWVETFGLTIIEGMAYGLPAIVPPLGGILEVIEDQVTGYAVDSRDHIKLSAVLYSLFSDRDRYVEFSTRAKNRLELFRDQKMKEKMNEIINRTSLY